MTSRLVTTHQAALHADGTISDSVTTRSSGSTAQEHRERQRTWNAKRFKEHDQCIFARVSPLARVESVTWAECTEKQCGWDTKVEYPFEVNSRWRSLRRCFSAEFRLREKKLCGWVVFLGLFVARRALASRFQRGSQRDEFRVQ